MLRELTPEKKIVTVFLLISFLLFLINEFKKEITGFTVADVNVASKIKIRVTSFDYPVYPDLWETINITTEIENSGSIGYDARMEIFIKNSTLYELGHYYDSLVVLNPGYRRSFRIYYTPTQYGVYYIQLRIYYGTRKMETWGVFAVLQPPVFNATTTTTTVIISEESITVTGAYGDYEIELAEYIKGKPAPKKKPVLFNQMEIEAPEMIEIPKGKTTVAYVKINNIGNSTLHNLKITTDVENVSVDIFPKVIMTFPMNTSAIFMISVNAPFRLNSGIYSMDLYISTDEIEVLKKVSLNVTDVNLKDLVFRTLMNYKFMVAELESQLEDASRRGLDASKMLKDLEIIKLDLSVAEEFYNKKDYEGAYQKLQEVYPKLQRLMMEIAILSIKRVKVFPILYILLITILIILLLVLLFYLNRRMTKKEKRPKILEKMEGNEEGGGL